MKNIRSFTLAVLIAAFAIWTSVQYSSAAEQPAPQKAISIQAVNEPLKDVLKKISKASGYEIFYNHHFADEKISIRLENVGLGEAIDRVLRAYNHFSLWDDSNKTIKLLIFKNNEMPTGISGIKTYFELATHTTTGQ